MAYVRRRVILSPPQVFTIPHQHGLHRTTNFTEPVRIASCSFTSVEAMFYACCLAQHGMISETQSFFETRPETVSNPGRIRTWIDGLFGSYHIDYRAAWLLNKMNVMQQVILALLQHQNNSFAWCLRRVQREFGNNIRFVEVTGSDHEQVWSSGHSERDLPPDPDSYVGSNLFGQTLTLVYAYFYSNGSLQDFPPAPAILRRNILPFTGFQQTAVIISDSTFRHASGIEGGDIWYEEGLCFKDLARAIENKHGNLLSFNIVIVSAGTNDSERYKDSKDRLESWNRMRSLLLPLRNHPYSRVIMSTGICLARWEHVPEYTRWFVDVFNQDFGPDRCDNFYLFNWAEPQDNFFFLPGGSPRVRFLDHDKGTPGHPNVSGTRKMWRCFARSSTELKPLTLLRFHTSGDGYKAGKLNSRDCLI